MGQVSIRNFNDEIVASLKLPAEFKNSSLEQELREIITAAASLSTDEKVALSRRLRSQFAHEEFSTHAAIRWGRDDEVREMEEKFDVP